MKKYLAEMVGTMVLVLMGCGAAVSLGCNPANAATVVGTAMAFGLAVVAMAYTIGGISGCHINPAITLGVYLSGRMSGKDALNYVIYQCIGGVIGAVLLYLLTSTAGITGTGANDLQAINEVQTISVLGGLVAEIVFTFVFVLVVLGVTAKTNAASALGGLAIGLSLVLVHLACIRYTGTSVNPARSIGPALFEGGSALAHLWIFIVGPLVGGALAACVWRVLELTAKKK